MGSLHTQATTPFTSEVKIFAKLLRGRGSPGPFGIHPADIQNAVKRGQKTAAPSDPRTGSARWRYTFRGITCVTDDASTRVITAYLPGEVAIPTTLPAKEHSLFNARAKDRLGRDLTLCTSHAVIVVDNSAAMAVRDIRGFKSRSMAALGLLALEFVAKERLSGGICETDVATVILMADRPRVAIEVEPVGLVLYNKLIETFSSQKPKGLANFLPALDMAELYLQWRSHPDCALSLFFLSPGHPSDAGQPIVHRVKAMAKEFGHQLFVFTLGFASESHDFSVLQAMTKVAEDAGATGCFRQAESFASVLGDTGDRSICSLTMTRSRSTTAHAQDLRPRELKLVEMEAAGSQWDQACSSWEMGDGWVVFTEHVKRLAYSPTAEREGRGPWSSVGLEDTANCIAIRRKALGEGAERLVFGMQEFDSSSKAFVGIKLVAKESRQAGVFFSSIGFHETFAKTQHTARRIAERFNERVTERVAAIASRHLRSTAWTLLVLPCFVYTFVDGKTERSVFSERKLDPSRRYTKWNGNNGYVNPGSVVSGFQEELSGCQEQQSRVAGMMEEVVDWAEGEYDSDGGSSVGGGIDGEEGGVDSTATTKKPHAATESRAAKRARPERKAGGVGLTPSFFFSPRAECYLQAFSHFSYVYSRRKMLVCDLQGVIATHPEGCLFGGVFELTDPVVHYKSDSGRTQVYGKTDLGKKGMVRFFETHKCNDVCRLLGISGGRAGMR